MIKIVFFIDELFHSDNFSRCYVSKYTAGKYPKTLLEDKSFKGAYLIPVKKNTIINFDYSVSLDSRDNNIEELPGWNSNISYYKHILNPKNYILLNKKIRHILEKFDFFWIRLPSPFGLWLGKKAEEKGKFVIYHLAGDIRDAYLNPKFRGIAKIVAKLMGTHLHKKTLKLSEDSHFICNGNILFDDFKKSRTNVHYFIHSFLKAKDLNPPKTDFKKTLKFLFVGRFFEEKGVFFLINFLKDIQNTFNLELHIVGFGEESDQKHVEQLSQSYDFITLHGFIPNGEQLFNIYRQCDILVMPSLNTEGFPRVILEAWSQGLYVISSKVGGIDGLAKDGKNILFFKPGDEIDLLQKCTLLMSNSETQAILKDGILEIQKVITFEHSKKILIDILEMSKN